MIVRDEKAHYTQHEVHQHHVQLREASGILFIDSTMNGVSYTSMLVSGDRRYLSRVEETPQIG